MKAVLVLGITFLLIILSVLNDISVLYPLILGLIITALAGVSMGFKIKEVLNMAAAGLKKSKVLYVIFILIGAITSLWMASGTVPGIMYYGFMIIKPDTFVMIAFLLTSVVSMLLGTSLGTVSTIGIALMAIGKGFGINPGIISGAIISGAYLGDRSSPMSSSAIVTSIVTESKLLVNLKYMMTTLIPGFLVSLALYFVLGHISAQYSYDTTTVLHIQNAINSSFNISPFVLIPPLIVMVLPLFKVDIKINMVIGILSSGVLTMILQKTAVTELLVYAVEGYNGQLTNPLLSQIIKGGGVLSMVKICFIIAVSSALNGVYEGTLILDNILIFFTKNIKKSYELVLKSTALSILTAVYGCSQTISIMMTGHIMKPVYKKLNISSTSLARTIADTCVVISPLIPWNIAGLVPAAALGVRVVDFVPYAFLCLVLPIITIIYSYIGYIKKTSINE